eukprot:TRINITY_DN8321_c0_g1_i1.p1 TRINITY_DN8321_c0_g1~~TRINITY_DN8321_c0_g1_i1.p1  ORF type:complete len:761 (+),score=128.41 TRINITY_DN8321_c0_g1_i1:342-2285(+)
MERILYFIYSGNIIRLFGMNLEETTDLMFLAKTYELWSLLRVLEWFMYISLDADNYFHILKLSRQNKVEEGVAVCKLFAVHHLRSILAVKEGITALGLDLFHEIVHHVHLTPNIFGLGDIQEIATQINSDITRDFKKILHEKIRADTTFNVNSEKLLCHSFIILGQCEKISVLFKNGTEDVELPEPYDNITADSLQACIKFLYYRDTEDITPVVACQLRDFSIDFGLSQLADTCSKIMQKSLRKRNLLSTLEASLKFRTKWGPNVTSYDLNETCVTNIFSSFSTFRFSETHDVEVLIFLLSRAQEKSRTGEWKLRIPLSESEKRDRRLSRMELRGSRLDVSHRTSITDINSKMERHNSIILRRRKPSSDPKKENEEWDLASSTKSSHNRRDEDETKGKKSSRATKGLSAIIGRKSKPLKEREEEEKNKQDKEEKEKQEMLKRENEEKERIRMEEEKDRERECSLAEIMERVLKEKEEQERRQAEELSDYDTTSEGEITSSEMLLWVRPEDHGTTKSTDEEEVKEENKIIDKEPEKVQVLPVKNITRGFRQAGSRGSIMLSQAMMAEILTDSFGTNGVHETTTGTTSTPVTTTKISGTPSDPVISTSSIRSTDSASCTLSGVSSPSTLSPVPSDFSLGTETERGEALK